jgi:hypothetical protein
VPTLHRRYCLRDSRTLVQQLLRIVQILKVRRIVIGDVHGALKLQVQWVDLVRGGAAHARDKFGWDVGHLHLLVDQGLEIHILHGEKRVVFDVVDAVLQRADTQCCVRVQQAPDEGLAVRVEARGEIEVLLAVHDLFEGALLVGGLEGGVAAEELVDQHTEGPVVDGLVVTLGQHQLSVRGHNTGTRSIRRQWCSDALCVIAR